MLRSWSSAEVAKTHGEVEPEVEGVGRGSGAFFFRHGAVVARERFPGGGPSPRSSDAAVASQQHHHCSGEKGAHVLASTYWRRRVDGPAIESLEQTTAGLELWQTMLPEPDPDRHGRGGGVGEGEGLLFAGVTEKFLDAGDVRGPPAIPIDPFFVLGVDFVHWCSGRDEGGLSGLSVVEQSSREQGAVPAASDRGLVSEQAVSALMSGAGRGAQEEQIGSVRIDARPHWVTEWQRVRAQAMQRALQRQSAMAGETLGQETLTVDGALPSLTEDVSKPRVRWGKKRGGRGSYLGGT